MDQRCLLHIIAITCRMTALSDYSLWWGWLDFSWLPSYVIVHQVKVRWAWHPHFVSHVCGLGHGSSKSTAPGITSALWVVGWICVLVKDVQPPQSPVPPGWFRALPLFIAAVFAICWDLDKNQRTSSRSEEVGTYWSKSREYLVQIRHLAYN